MLSERDVDASLKLERVCGVGYAEIKTDLEWPQSSPNVVHRFLFPFCSFVHFLARRHAYTPLSCRTLLLVLSFTTVLRRLAHSQRL